nr:unnamed protein product [Spirometra erinaceieuropaei]
MTVIMIDEQNRDAGGVDYDRNREVGYSRAVTDFDQEEHTDNDDNSPIVNENTMASEASELTFQSAQGDCEDCTVDSFCASESPEKPIPFISPMTSPISKDCDSLQRGADHQAWGDHALPRVATDTFLPSPPACSAIVNGGRVPPRPPPCPAPTPAESQISMLSLDSEASESLRNDANDETVVSSVLAPVRTAPVPLTTPACSTSTESVDAFSTRTERVAPATGLHKYESRSYSPAHLVVDTCPPPSEAVRNLVEGRPSLSSPCISCRSQSFFPPSGDQQGGINVNVRLTMTLPAENPAIVEASSSVVFTTFFRERFKMEHADCADATQPSVVLTAQADSRATASLTAHGRNNAASRQANPEEQASTSSRQSSEAAAPDISTVQEELDQLPLAEEGSLEERVACHLARIVADAIRKLRNNKAPGEDGIPAEIFKSCVDTLAPWLHEVIERVWRDEVVPDDWGLGILVPILKKGDKTRCENYRGISLIDVAAKIFAIVLLGRFQAVRDSRTRPNQTGFRAGRGCADQIFTLRRILEFRHSYQQPTAVCFVDFAAAFDSVHRESLWRIMALDLVPAKIIAMIKAYYRSTTARVLVRNNFSQPFGIRSGVRQGCILSPILFNYAIDWILGRALRDSDGVEFAPGHRLTDLDYADDIALLASSFGDLQSMVSRVNEVAKSVGMSINAGKAKVFSSCIPDQEKAPLGIDGCQLEEVDSFKYLGARLLPNGQSKDDIVSRIDAARWVFSSLRKCLWNRRDLSIATKIRVYRASVRSILLYGCECWALRVADERKLEVFDHHCLRIILRVKLTDFVSNEIVRARCDNIARITQAIQERRLRWFGHVLRRPPQELSVTALDPAPLPNWRRRRGGQFKTWLDTVRQDMEVVLGPSVFGLRRWRREWVELSRSAAADRHAWRGTIRDIIEAG